MLDQNNKALYNRKKDIWNNHRVKIDKMMRSKLRIISFKLGRLERLKGEEK